MHVQASSCGSTAAYERCGGAASATPATPSRKQRHHGDDMASAEKTQRSEPRRNPLVAAMMEAVKSLVPAAKPGAAAATTTTTAAAATPASDAPAAQADGLKEAALAFAHALYGALRSAGESTEGDSCRMAYGCGEGERSQGKAKGWGRGDYDDLPQRLEALAQQIVGTPKAAANPPPAAKPAPAAVTAAVTTSAASTAATSAVAASADAATTGSVAEAATAAAATPITATSIQVAPPQTQAATASENPLVTAFRQLFEALNPKGDKKALDEKADDKAGAATEATEAAAAAPAPSAAEQLAAFLRQLAQSLRSARGDSMAVTPTTGGLIDVAA